MDGSTLVTETNAFLTWFNTWGSAIYAITNIVYWLALGFAAVFAAVQYKRLVDFKVGKAPKSESGAETASVSVEEFVD